MRKRFEQQLRIGQALISDIQVNPKCRDAFPKLVLSLKELYLNPTYNERLFEILEERITKDKQSTGRPGMDLWILFVLAQTRLCLKVTYDRLHHMANNDRLLRQILGIETEHGFERIEFEYQNILDNVSLLDDTTVKQINEIVVDMGHRVFKKKETEALRLKTDSFVVESNVHFPTDYNLLWDSARKSIDTIESVIKRYSEITGWRKLSDWYRSLKNKMRALGQASKPGGKNRDERVEKAATQYLQKAKLFAEKIKKERVNFPINDYKDIALSYALDYYLQMLEKHIDLIERRVIKREKIPHCEKVFSIFETYTEWINKGKQHPNVELGKSLQITTDQHHLIVDYKIMEHEVDKHTVIDLADRILQRYNVESWSFDKGFYLKENKDLLSLFINNLVMPKKGKLNQSEKTQEHDPAFKKLRNKHSAVESNINELENRGLGRCPDKGYAHFKRYVAMGVCAYNLHKIGAELMRQEQILQQKQQAHRKAA
jgi:transposase, IS5 family